VPITSVTPAGARARLHLAALRLIARSGHVRRGATLIRPFFRRDDSAMVTFPGGGKLLVSLSDAHWARVPAGLEYEAAVERMLSSALARPDTYLVDCGANIGYWSSYFASSTTVVAIEPNPDLFATLQHHATLNGFEALRSAIWSATGELVEFTWNPDAHEAGGLTAGGLSAGLAADGSRVAQVATTTLDDVHRAHARGRTAVVKLDVEGVELAAVDGGTETLTDGLLVYEDHGSDRTHATTSGLLERGFAIRWPHDDGTYQPIDDVARLGPLKVRERSGYNLVAFRPASSWGELF
jgi:FkbM family methyltransferase